MTEPTPRPEVDVLADYVEGLLDASARADVERHIADDPATAALVAELAALPALLAATPVEPMPADVIARVDAALVRAAQDRAAQDRAAGDHAAQDRAARAAGATGRRVSASRWRRWLTPALAVGATVGVIAIAGPVVLDGGDDSGGDSAAESTSEEPAAQDSAEESGPAAEPGRAGDDGAAPESEQEYGIESPDGRPELSSARFASQVERLYVDAEQLTAEDIDAATSDVAERRLTLSASLLPGAGPVRVAPLCFGDLESTVRTAIAFDGEPAYLLVYGNPLGDGPQQAVAFRCRGDRYVILDQEPVDLP